MEAAPPSSITTLLFEDEIFWSHNVLDIVFNATKLTIFHIGQNTNTTLLCNPFQKSLHSK